MWRKFNAAANDDVRLPHENVDARDLRGKKRAALKMHFHFETMMFTPGPLQKIAPSVVLGTNVRIYDFVNLYGCTIGDDTKIGTFVEIQKNARIGARCKISSHTFVCEGVTIEDEVFVGHHVCFTNDLRPRATNTDGELQSETDWSVVPTIVKRGASIGSGAVILAGVTIGENAMIGAGAVVTKNVAAGETVAGVPARSMIRTHRESTTR